MAHGINGNGLILRVHQPFISRIEAVVDPRDVKPWKPYLISIDHKLNVARYNAGLISALTPEDYGKHFFTKNLGGDVTKVEYTDRCVYYARDWDQYALGLLSFIDSFAAAAFSLFDSCGHLLTQAYNLSLPRKEPTKSGGTVLLQSSFSNAASDIKGKGAQRMYDFLEEYLLDSSKCKDWKKILKKLRNHTTHSQITDVVELVVPMPPEQQRIDLRSKKFGGPDNQDIKDFVEESFLGLEEFTEQLYEKLTIQVENEKSVPITGRYDNLI